VLEGDPKWADWSVKQMRAQAQLHELAINPVIYAELSLAFEQVEDLDRAIETLQLELLALPRPALFLAGKAFAKYRQRGGKRPNVLADFFIGAHAAVMRCGVLTRDTTRYRSYFPGVKLITPSL
jgi:predicted nucleic acid-binding protein